MLKSRAQASLTGSGTETYPSGDTYQGEFVNGIRCGNGTLYCKCGDKYEGEWKANLFHGRGIFTDAKSGNQYTGLFEEGLRHGPHGALRNAVGQLLYLGDWVKDKRQGRGLQLYYETSQEGSNEKGPQEPTVKQLYQGEFQADQRWGRGVIVHDPPPAMLLAASRGDAVIHAELDSLVAASTAKLPSPSPFRFYDGIWEKDQPHGLGREVYRSGAAYIGPYERGQKCGLGVYWYPDGSRYEGKFKRNLPHGKGVLRYANGDLYEGYFVAGEKHGQGRCIRRDGVKYDGKWKRGVPHGDNSTVQCKDGDLYRGYAHLGKVLGERQHPLRERLRRQVYSDDSTDSWDESEESEDDGVDYEALYKEQKDRLHLGAPTL
eukprot:gene6244-4493_t